MPRPKDLAPSGTLPFQGRTKFYHRLPKGTGPFPLVIGLHGYSGQGEGMLRALATVGGDWVCAALNAPAPFISVLEHDTTGYSWFTREERDTWLPISLELVLALREKALREWPVDPERIFVVGMSQGGALALECAITYPELFRGAVAISAFLARSRDNVPLPVYLGETRFLLTIGDQDEVVRPERTLADADYLRENGYPIDVKRFAKGHVIRLEELRFIREWITQNGPQAVP